MRHEQMSLLICIVLQIEFQRLSAIILLCYLPVFECPEF